MIEEITTNPPDIGIGLSCIFLAPGLSISLILTANQFITGIRTSVIIKENNISIIEYKNNFGAKCIINALSFLILLKFYITFAGRQTI